ncbi:hypothetical protein Fcan01_14211 [Folsomia candida]|uniref:F-box domain-containing protein n=1 Tax=Folsomia candida TaxID=158441 RepID=A0A226E024_FOLCA|nr:hypothetical protein Fcan01_14211 [Folsomia candida]
MRRRRGPKRKTVPPPPSPPAKNEIDDDDETEDDDVEVEVVDESTTVHPYDGRLRSRKRRDAVASRPRYQRRRRRSSSSSRPPTPRLIRIDDRGNFIESGEGVPDPFKWQGTVHPLLIPDVLVNVMLRLEFSDFRNTQLVCKQWRMECLRIMPLRTSIYLNCFKDVAGFMRIHENCHHRFTHMRIGHNLNLQDHLMQRFFSKFGPYIEYLHLEAHWIPASLRRILFEKLPNLEEFILCSQRICEFNFLPSSSRHEPEQKLPNVKILRVEAKFETSGCHFLQELLSVMPNLTVVTGFDSMKGKRLSTAPKFSRLGSLHYEQWDNQTDTLADGIDADLIFSKILYRNRHFRFTSLKSVKVVFDVDMVYHLRVLPLKSLEIIVPSQTFESWHPRQVHLFSHILSFNKTLKSLKVNYCSGKTKLFSTFDGIKHMNSLRHLTLHRVSGNLDFLSLIPQLKSLHMTQEDFFEYYDEFHVHEQKPHKLESLKLYYTSWSVSSLFVELPRPAKVLNVMQIIIQRFPKLKSFRMESITDRALDMIYAMMPQLEELEVTNGSFTSAGLSGIPITDESLCAIVRRLGLKEIKTEFCYEFTQPMIQWASKIWKDRGSEVIINPYCGNMEVEQIHEFLNENGPIHVSIPDFPVYKE